MPKVKIDKKELLRLLSESDTISDLVVPNHNIENISFEGKILSNIDFSCNDTSSILKGVNFKQAKLNQCNFDGTKLSNCLFKEANLKSISFEDCELNECNFDKAFLREVRFSKSKIAECRFRECDLEWIDFRYTKIQRVTFQDAEMKGCDFYRSEFVGVNVFDGSKIMDASLNKTLLEGASLRMDNLFCGILQESEQKYKEYQEGWTRLRKQNHMFPIITNGVLQESSKSFLLYHTRWAIIRQNHGELLPLSDKMIHVFLKERLWEAMQVYRLLHGAWISKGYMRDAAWAYTKLKRLETKTYLPQFAWIIYNRKIPERISNKKYMRALKKIGYVRVKCGKK